jgi:transcriptional regulator with GAF, ATPase, and Fis domain
MVFESQAMRNVQEMIDAVGPTDTTVLILGESGTGKEMVAQAIHERSPRAQQRLVPIDGSGLQENLFESELFGHERGAFTSADRQKRSDRGSGRKHPLS